jgi:WD40 repeat protein
VNILFVGCFSKDARHVLAATEDGHAYLWDRKSQILEFSGYKGLQIHSLAYTSSGWLVSAGSDGTIGWWWTRVKGLTRAIQSIPIPDLTPAERRQFPDLFPQ